MSKPPFHPSTTSRQNLFSFSLPPSIKEETNTWITTCANFFKSVVLDIDPTPANQDLVDAFRDRVTDIDNELETATPDIEPKFKETVEPLSVQMLVQLITLLGSFSSTLRVASAKLIIKFAEILTQKRYDSSDMAVILATIQSTQTTTVKGTDCVLQFFHRLGSSFSLMAIAVICGLEVYSTSTDWRLRTICNTSIAQLIMENQVKIIQEDQLLSIWNLYFALGSISSISPIFPDRIVVLKALNCTCELYARQDLTLSSNVVNTFMRITNKSAEELLIIKDTISKIFDISLEILPSSKSQKQKTFETYYSIFLELISTQEESSFDILGWSIETFFQTENGHSRGTAFKTSVSQLAGKKEDEIEATDALQDFCNSLLNHFNAPQALVRFASALALHAVIRLCPSFPMMNRSIWVSIVAGVLDTDLLTCGVYLNIVQLLKLPDSAQITAMIESSVGNGGMNGTYDELHAFGTTNVKVLNKSELLDLVVKHSPPISVSLLHKMANTLEFMTPKAKIQQLELIRIWGRKTNKLDTFLMKMLIPMCSNRVESVQLKAIEVTKALLPGFSNASPTDAAFLWSHISALLVPTLKKNIILSALELLRAFPLNLMTATNREMLLDTLFALIFHNDPNVRLSVYEFFGSCLEFLHSSLLLDSVLGFFLLTLGDADQKNLKALVELINQMGGTFFNSILVPLGNVRDLASKTHSELIRGYDELCTSIATNKAELRSAIDAALQPKRLDLFWNFFLEGIPENQLARPEEYQYGKGFVHDPVWISLLCTKLNVPPPPIGGDSSTRREQVPTTPMGKRRFLLGFTHCLFPFSGSWNPIVRRNACTAITYCCFKGYNAQGPILRSLLENIQQLFLTSKYVTYQVSALDIFSCLVRLKIPGVAESLFQQYYDLCVEFLHNTHSAHIQVAVLRLLEMFLMVFPKGMNSKLQETRDITRSLLVSKDREVREAAFLVYPLVFKAVLPQNAKIFEAYLRNEITLLQHFDAPEAKADPWISYLNQNQVKQLLLLNILCMGHLTTLGEDTFSTAQFLMQFLTHADPQFRSNAFVSLINLISVMESVDASTVIWIVLPLYADLSYNVRLEWSRFRQNIPNNINQRCVTVTPYADDDTILAITSWEEILTDHLNLAVNSKFLSELVMDIPDLIGEQNYVLPTEDYEYHLPTISEKLMSRLKELINTFATLLPPAAQAKVKYQWSQYSRVPHLEAVMFMLLSEFGCLHTDNFDDTAGVLVSNLSRELTTSNTAIIEACIVGISNILTGSRLMSRETSEALITISEMSEGELLALVYLFPHIGQLKKSVMASLMHQFCHIICSTRHTQEKRLLAASLAVECALKLESENSKTVLDALQQFLESLQLNTLREKVYKIAGKLIPKVGEKHPLFKAMAVQSKKFVKSKDPLKRMQSLSIFRIFAKSLPKDEFMTFLFGFLADSDSQIRETAKNIAIDDDLVSFAAKELDEQTPEVGQRGWLMENGRLPCMSFVGIQINIRPNKDGSAIDDNWTVDPFNIRYYKSDHRKMYTSHFKVEETQFQREVQPLTLGIMKAIDIQLSGLSESDQASYYEGNKRRNLQPILVLQALLPHSPLVAEKMVTELLSRVEDTVNPSDVQEGEEDDDTSDVEVMAHKIDILTNLLMAHGKKGDYVPDWLLRLESYVNNCCSIAVKLRHTLYADIEKSFYFCNQFADIPIISEEQMVALQELRDLSQEAIYDIVKSGKTEKIDLVDNKNDQWDGEADSESDNLRRLTILSLHVLSGISMYYIMTRDLIEEQVATYMRSLVALLDEEHRGLRLVVVDSLVYLANLMPDLQSRKKVLAYINSVVKQLLSKLTKDHQSLFRKKSDYISLISQLIIHCEGREMQRELIKILLMLWKDPDSDVREVSINMVQYLGEKKLPEVLLAFQEHTDARDPTHEQEDTIDIMKEMVILGNNEEYPDKEKLQSLLKWRIANMLTLDSSEEEVVVPVEPEFPSVPVPNEEKAEVPELIQVESKPSTAGSEPKPME